MMRALVVDDEAPARDELAWLLAAHPEISVLQAGSASAALTAIADERPDVVFQDIQMPGKDGFHVLRESLSLPSPPLFVFVTAYNDYAIQAFEENAVDYLLKPVSADRLAKSLTRVRSRLGERSGRPEERQVLERLLEGMGLGEAAKGEAARSEGRSEKLDRLPVEQAGRIRLLPFSEIVLCRVEGKRILVLADSGTFHLHGVPSIEKLEERLQGRPFFRIGRGELVNLRRIAEFTTWVNGKYVLIMDDRERTHVTVCRSRVKDFRHSLGI